MEQLTLTHRAQNQQSDGADNLNIQSTKEQSGVADE